MKIIRKRYINFLMYINHFHILTQGYTSKKPYVKHDEKVTKIR